MTDYADPDELLRTIPARPEVHAVERVPDLCPDETTSLPDETRTNMSFEAKPENRNLFEWFRACPFGFEDFGKWRDHHFALHAKHSLDCAEFGGEWIAKWIASQESK